MADQNALDLYDDILIGYTIGFKELSHDNSAEAVRTAQCVFYFKFVVGNRLECRKAGSQV